MGCINPLDECVKGNAQAEEALEALRKRLFDCQAGIYYEQTVTHYRNEALKYKRIAEEAHCELIALKLETGKL
jgi:hypothetical protein